MTTYSIGIKPFRSYVGSVGPKYSLVEPELPELSEILQIPKGRSIEDGSHVNIFDRPVIERTTKGIVPSVFNICNLYIHKCGILKIKMLSVDFCDLFTALSLFPKLHDLRFMRVKKIVHQSDGLGLGTPFNNSVPYCNRELFLSPAYMDMRGIMVKPINVYQ